MDRLERASQDALETTQAAFRCWAAWRSLLDKDLAVTAASPRPETVREIDHRISALARSVERLTSSIDDAGGAFEAVAREPFDAGPVEAGSAHRAALKVGEYYLKESRDLADEFLAADPPLNWSDEDDERRSFFGFRLQYLVDSDEFARDSLMAEIEWESGQARSSVPPPSKGSIVDRIEREPVDELLGAKSVDLRGLSRGLLNEFARHPRTSLSIRELRRLVWDDTSDVLMEGDKNAVQSAVSELRVALRELDRGALADRIQWSGTGYMLR
ncbi:MAG: helix-turn-helix domain-containing protein [Planctomycetota bacterium]|jgi:hypothetical protein